MIGFLIALLSGTLMSVQGVFNTRLTQASSIWLAAAWVQLTALAVCIIGWFFTGRERVLDLFSVSPSYMLLGGVMGAFITYTVVKSMDSMGPAPAVLVIVVSQIAAAYFIELFGWFGTEKVEFSWMKLLGLVLAAGGIWLFQSR